jgi:hypothetical protein
VPVWILHSQPLLHFFNDLVITPKPFPMRWHLWGLQRGENLREQDLGCRVGGEEQSIRVLWLLPVFSSLCGRALSCWRRITATFLWGRTLLKCFCKFLTVWMYRSELMDWPRGIMSTKITPSASQKNSGHDFLCWRGNLKLLPPLKG